MTADLSTEGVVKRSEPSGGNHHPVLINTRARAHMHHHHHLTLVFLHVNNTPQAARAHTDSACPHSHRIHRYAHAYTITNCTAGCLKLHRTTYCDVMARRVHFTFHPQQQVVGHSLGGISGRVKPGIAP